MLTEFIRDQTFTIAWFGLMTMVWLGWAQEDPPRTWRLPLGLGSVLGVAIAGGFGLVTVRNWDAASALEGSFHWFGVLVAVEVVAAGVGCALLARAKAPRWMAWWVAVVIAVHFVPLGILLADWSVGAFGLVQTAGLVWLVRRLRHAEYTTSRMVGPWMGATLLGYALISVLLYLL